MTGFGRGCAETPEKRITIEIKSLNSKQLDLSVRLPQCFRENEITLRNMIASSLTRGKVEAVALQEHIGAPHPARIDRAMIAAYKDDLQSTCNELGIGAGEQLLPILMRLPDVLTQENRTPDESEQAALADATRAALDALVEFRRTEGTRLELFFREKIDAISGLLSRVSEFESERIPRLRRKLEEQLSKLDFDYNPERLEQELIFYIEKLDVTEEKTRLQSHLRYFSETLSGEPGQGKKLGFIAQEMGREINTLGSKANNAEMQRIVVMMKDELEQIKEQVLNVL